MAIFWGLLGAFSFGVADLIAREATLRESNLTAAFYLHMIGGLFAALPFLFGETFPAGAVFSRDGALGLLVGVVMVTGTLALYQALALGPVLIVAPVVSTFAVVSAALAIVISGEQPAPLQLAGMAVTMGGVILAVSEISGGESVRWLTPGVGLGLVASLAYGLAFWLLNLSSDALGSVGATLFVRIAATVTLLALFAARRLPLGVKSRASLKWLLPIALIDSIGTWAVAQGYNTGLTSVVSVLVALFAVVTVVLAFFIYEERITRWQWLGILITFAGVALVST